MSIDMSDLDVPLRPAVNACELAVATHLNLLLITPGVPHHEILATIVAQRIPGLMSPLPGTSPLHGQKPYHRVPFRAPHYTVSPKGLISEMHLAAGGVLFLGGIQEYAVSTLRQLGEALEEMRAPVAAVKASGSMTRHELVRRVTPIDETPIIVASTDLKGAGLSPTIRSGYFAKQLAVIPFPVRVELPGVPAGPSLAVRSLAVGQSDVYIGESSEEIRNRIESTPPELREIARDVVLEAHGHLADHERYNRLMTEAWKILRQPTANPRGNPAKRAPAKPQRVVAKLQHELTPFGGAFTVTAPDQLARELGSYMDLANEVFLVIFLSTRNKVIGYTEFASGAVASVTVHPGGIFQAALLCGAAGFVTVHNHPGGDPKPSSDDYALWSRLRLAGETMGIPLVDNLVISAGGKYFSQSEDER